MATAIGIRSHWREIMGVFLKLGAMSYGGPAIMGMMQAEIQEKRGWLPKENFVEGLALVNMLPGAGATQLGIFLGFTRAGWWGGLLAGLCFVLPAFVIMLVLTWTYLLPLWRAAVDTRRVLRLNACGGGYICSGGATLGPGRD